MIVVLTGDNDFLRVSELKKIKSDYVSEYGDFGLEVIDASETPAGRILESVSSVPFLAEKRMVILNNLPANKHLAENIEELLDAVAESTELIISERKFDKRLTLYKTLKKRTEMKQFDSLGDQDLAKWMVQYASESGGELKLNDALYLLQRIGPNQMMLASEIEKLISYNLKVTKQSIDLLVEPTPSSSMFDLLDSAFSGNKKRTLELYDDQRRQQVEPQAIMGMIAWQIHIIAVTKFNEKNDPSTLASKAKLNPFVVRKTLDLVRGLSQNQVKQLVSRATELDARLKSEAIDADDAVQNFLLTI